MLGDDIFRLQLLLLVRLLLVFELLLSSLPTVAILSSLSLSGLNCFIPILSSSLTPLSGLNCFLCGAIVSTDKSFAVCFPLRLEVLHFSLGLCSALFVLSLEGVVL
uniref:Uncharacterized protein n=1 Tax=Cacopsylla melanoneura TaxID=428564 RepID=A0A8D8PZ34_9HEMI